MDPLILYAMSPEIHQNTFSIRRINYFTMECDDRYDTSMIFAFIGTYYIWMYVYK